MNPYDDAEQAKYIGTLQGIPRDKDGPVFAEPWEAQAFAIAVNLSQRGHFSWREWTIVLGEELAAAANRGEFRMGEGYYQCWLRALERMVVSKGLADQAFLDRRKEAWADSYRHTPHGAVVELHEHAVSRVSCRPGSTVAEIGRDTRD